MISLHILMFVTLLAAIEDLFYCNFDIIWIILSSCVYLATGAAVKYLLIGILFLLYNPLEYFIGSGDCFFIAIITPFIRNINVFIWICFSSTMLLYIVLQSRLLPLLLPLVLGLVCQI